MAARRAGLGRGAAILGLIGPAALIVLGLRAALTGADWWWIALPLGASLPLHLIDLRNRLSAAPAVPPPPPL